MPFNINKLPADGYLIVPLSMSRLANGQSADACYEILQYFEAKLTMISLDVVFLYTNGLYYNVDDTALAVRRTVNEQMVAHKNRLQNLILKNRQYVPGAFHYLPWDYVLLNGENYQACLARLNQEYKEQEAFRNCVLFDLDGREPTNANIHFVLEEVVATHLIRQKQIEFPKTLVRSDTFRMVIYPGPYIHSDYYQYEKKLLPLSKSPSESPYDAAHYDYTNKILYDFRDIDR